MQQSFGMVLIRKIARIFLFSISLLLILNSVLPHHHHHDEVCFINTHCSDDETDLTCDNNEHKGVEHDHHSDETNFCQLNDFYLASVVKKASAKIKLSNFDKDLTSCATSNACRIEMLFSTNTPKKIPIDDQKGLTAKYLTRALRAPPVC